MDAFLSLRLEHLTGSGPGALRPKGVSGLDVRFDFHGCLFLSLFHVGTDDDIAIGGPRLDLSLDFHRCLFL